MSASSDGALIASGQESSIGFPAPVCVWNAADGTLVHKLELHKGAVQAVAFSPSGKLLATLGGQDDGRVIVYDVATGEALCGAKASNERATCVRWLNNTDDSFVTAGVNHIKVWQLSERNLTGANVSTGSLKRHIECLVVDAEDKYLYAGTSTGDILKVNVQHRSMKMSGPSKEPFSRGVHAIALTKRGNLVAGSGSGDVAVLLADNLRVVKKKNMGGFVSSLVLNRAKDHFFVATRQSELSLVHLASFESELRSTAHSSPVVDVAFAAGYSELFATAAGHEIRVWQTSTRTELLRISVPTANCNCVTFQRDGKGIVSGWDDGKIRVFLPQSGKLRQVIGDAHLGGVTAVSTTSDSARLVSGGAHGEVRVWAASTGRLLASLKEHKGSVNSLQVNDDDSECVSASADGSCITWNLNKFTRATALFASTIFRSAVYSPDQSQVLTCGTDRKVTYYDAVDGQPIRILDGSATAELTSVDIAADGETFVSVGGDRIVRLWAYDEGRCLGLGLGHSGTIAKVAIAPNQRYAVSVGEEGAIFVWDLPRTEGQL